MNGNNVHAHGPRGGLLRHPLRSAASLMAGNPWGKPTGNGGGHGDDGGDGSRPSNPWTDPPAGRPGGRSRGPTALDELLKRRPRGPGGGDGPGGGLGQIPGGPRTVGWIAAGVIGIYLLWTSFHIISPEQEGVVTRFGSYSRTLSPGFNLTMPPPFEQMTKVDVRQIRTMQIGSPSASDENFVLTSDQNIIDLAYEVRWLIRDPERFLFQVKDNEGTIREVAESAMRASVANFNLNQAIGPGRAGIEVDVQRRAQAMLDEYGAGVSIQGVAIRQADPPEKVNEAFKEVTSARQEREGALNNARAFAQRVLEGARGETAEFDVIYEQYRLAPAVTKRRLYYETMEQVLANVDKTVVEARGVTPFLPLNEARRRLAEPAAVEQGAP